MKHDDYVASLRKSFENRIKNSFTSAPVSGENFGSGGMGGATGSRNEGEVYSHFKGWVYSCVKFISQRIAAQPFCAGELIGADENPTRSYDRIGQKKARPHARKHQVPARIWRKSTSSNGDIELIGEHPVLDALEVPNEVQSRFEFVYMSVANLLLTGECYWIIGAAKDKETREERLELWAVPTEWIVPKHDKGPFSSYVFKMPGSVGEGTPLKPENVCRTAFVNPRSLTKAWSPLHAVLVAARSDDSLQYSQEQMFSRGIHPNLIVTMAENRGIDGKPTGTRPRLTGVQRQAIIRAIREVWSRTSNYGDPAIIDGLIGDIRKLQMTPQEMDFLQSGNILRDRIFKAFGLNPIVLGEIQGANRASAVEAEKQSCSNALNPIIEMLTATLTNRLGPLYDDPERLLIWVEPCHPTDPELDIRRWDTAMRHKAAGSNELRSELLGLPPREENVERNELLSTVGGMQGTVLILQQVAQGVMGPDQAAAALMLFLEIDEETARAMVGGGDGGTVPLPNNEPPPKPDDEGEEVDDEELDDNGVDAVDDAVRSFGGVMFDTLKEFESSILAKVKECGQGF